MSRCAIDEIDLAITPRDLVWSLDSLQDKDRGKVFLTTMSKYLPIYSPLVKHIYMEYDVAFTGDNAVILPRRYSFTETYSRIEPDSIRRVGLQLIPTNKGVEVLVKRKPSSPDKPPITVIMPINMGLRLIQKRLQGTPFLPVIQKGDLREYQLSQPSLQLHTLDVRKLNDLSHFNKMDIARAIHSRLGKLAAAAGQLYL